MEETPLLDKTSGWGLMMIEIHPNRSKIIVALTPSGIMDVVAGQSLYSLLTIAKDGHKSLSVSLPLICIDHIWGKCSNCCSTSNTQPFFMKLCHVIYETMPHVKLWSKQTLLNGFIVSKIQATFQQKLHKILALDHKCDQQRLLKATKCDRIIKHL